MSDAAWPPVFIDDTVIDTLTVKFWRDQPGPLYKGPPVETWVAQIGPNIAEGVGGFGPTPLAALRELCENIARDEGRRSDNGKVFLR